MVFMLLDSFEGVTEVRRSFTVGSLGDINPETGNIYGLEIDSNNNGVKDLIEQSLGLNPLGDNDADPRIQALKDQAKEYQYNQVNELTQSPERGYQLDAEGNIEGK